MVECSQFLDDYSAFRDGLLAREVERSYREHLAACPSCARYDRVIEQGARLFRDLPPVEPSQDFVPRLQHRLFHLEEEMRRPGRLGSGTPVAFTLALAAVIGASAWAPAMRPRPAEFHLPPVLAHAPHRIEGVRVLFQPAPMLAPLPGDAPVGSAASNLLFYRYSPLGSYVAQPASLKLPQ